MIFNTNVAFNVEMKDVKYLGAGIHDDVALLGTRFEKSPNGNLFIEFLFGKDGAKFTHTEYEPQKYQDQSDAEFQLKVDNQVARIMQIMKCFYPKEQLSYIAESFTAFGNWITALGNGADKNILVRAKVVYNNNGFTGLPRYSKYTFIEPMSVSKADSKISELGIDNFVRPTQGDQEQQTKTAIETFTADTNSVVEASTPF